MTTSPGDQRETVTYYPDNSDKCSELGTASALQDAADSSSSPGERSHHPYSPSSLQSLEACPHYASRDSKHIRTIAGTLAHKATETREDNDELSDDDAIHVAACLDFYDKIKSEMEEESRIAFEAACEDCHLNSCPMPEPSDSSVEEGTETYLEVDDLTFSDCRSTTAGYVDRWILSYDRKHGKLVDWKFGVWPVEDSENNLQGMAYMMGLFRKFPSLETVEVIFKQPLIDTVTRHTFSRADLPSIYLRIQTVVARARLAREKESAGDWSMAQPRTTACNFCAKIGLCPRVQEFACKVGKKFHPLGLPDDITPTMIQDPQNTKIAMELAAVVKVWGEAFKRQVADRVIRGDAVMPEGYGSRTVQKRELVSIETYKNLALNFLTPQEWESCLDTTFGQVEKIISRKAPRGMKEKTVEEFQAQGNALGATKLGQPFSFLAMKSEKLTKQT